MSILLGLVIILAYGLWLYLVGRLCAHSMTKVLKSSWFRTSRAGRITTAALCVLSLFLSAFTSSFLFFSLGIFAYGLFVGVVLMKTDEGTPPSDNTPH